MKTTFYFVFAFLSTLCLCSVDGTNIYVNHGHKVKINCGDDVKNKDVEWTYDKSLIARIIGKSGSQHKGPIRKPVLKPNGEALEISGVDEKDVGLYTCKVGDRKNEHRLYIVSASASPSNDLQPGTGANLECRVTGNPQPSVEWLRPGGEKVGTSFQFQLSPVTLKDSGVWVCQLSQDGETHQWNLTLNVKSPNPTVPSPGHGGVFVTQCSQCRSDPQPVPGVDDKGKRSVWEVLQWGLSLRVWVAVGAGSVVLILLVVLVVLLLCRNRRMKKRARKLRTVRVPRKSNEYCHCTQMLAGPPKGRPREKPSPVARQHR